MKTQRKTRCLAWLLLCALLLMLFPVTAFAADGGESPEETPVLYSASLLEAEHGSLAFEAAPEEQLLRCEAGTDIVLQAAAEDGYQVQTVSVLDEAGNLLLEAEDTGSGFRFAMPEQDVFILAEFSADEAENPEEPEPSEAPAESEVPEISTGPETPEDTEEDTPEDEENAVTEIITGTAMRTAAARTVSAVNGQLNTGFTAVDMSATGTVTTASGVPYAGYINLAFYDAQGALHHLQADQSSSIHLYTVGGNIAYCIQPNLARSPRDYSAYLGTSTDAATEAWTLLLTENQRNAITLALLYGYPNKTYGCAAADQASATQIIIWEIVMGYRSATAPYGRTSTTLLDSLNFSGHEDALTVYNSIAAQMADHGKIPSFTTTSQAQAASYKTTLTWNTATRLYGGSVTDSNGVLSNYSFTASGTTFSQSGNTLNISASESTVSGTVVTGQSEAYLDESTAVVVVWDEGNQAWTGYGNQNGQTLVGLKQSVGPVKVYFSMEMEKPTGAATLIKTSANSAMVEKNTCYSLVGTTYGLYTDAGCTNRVGIFTVNADGTSNTIENLTAGTYYYKELTAGKGYQLDTTVRSVQVPSGDTAVIEVEDTPIGDPIVISIEKENKDASSVANAAPLSLAGAKFSITYYSGMYTTEAAAEAAVSAGTIQKRTWYITAKEYSLNGVTRYLASMDNGTPEGDALFRDLAGNIIIPMGTVVIKESQAPTGYVNSADFHFVGSTASLGSSVVVQFDGSGKALSLTTGNYLDELNLEVYEPSVKGGVKVRKVDADTKQPTAQGNAALDGAKFGIYSNNDYVVYLNGKGYSKGDLITTITTDANGNAATASNALPYGDYYLMETQAPTGYVCSTRQIPFSISANGAVVDLGDYTDNVIKGTVQLKKWALNTVTETQQPEAGATFEIWLKTAGSYANAKDAEKDVITIGEDGVGTSKQLPYGTYLMKQTSGWEGYDIDETVYEVSISENGKTVTHDTAGDDLTIYNDIWTGTLSILKVDGDTKEPLSGAEFTLTGSDGSQVVLVTDDSGSVTFEDLYYGVNYTWTETASPKGYLLDENNTGTWTVAKHDDTIEITCDDFRRPGSITVTKQSTKGEPLAGCTFLLEYLDGSTWKPVTARDEDSPVTLGATTSGVTDGCLTTGADGVVTFEGLWADDALQYRLTEVDAPDGYTLLSEPVFEGVLPVSYPEGEVTAEPDELIGGAAYYYDLPITVRNGKIYTLPLTGGSGYPFGIWALLALSLGTMLMSWAVKHRTNKNTEKERT